MPEDDDDQLVPHENVYDKFASDDNDDDDDESEEVVDEVDEDNGIDELDKMSGVEWEWVLDKYCWSSWDSHQGASVYVCTYFGNTLLIID